ncbi:RimJ/RimL family protein N-acetyltransferase [Microterricola gilva]|uniref:RimJ/RimL family protein N-acetyltransferase n=1 Tax=Microterricola gilva TaxID=393267 RepID=A0A4V2GAE6_9MICO|nr:GNAT family N-acetyltransferase [Microterricola gilva]RZU63966.1 RimJ/RimL family protein N-acetyltransferase [Microterricola gilva]
MHETITLRPWGHGDLAVLERSNTQEATRFLGGPESAEALANRHARFLRLWREGEARMFAVESSREAEAVGSIGYWKKSWQGEDVYETGWSIATPYQGRGLATQALAACVADAARHGERRWMLAFPRIDNAASNALCRAAGFTLRGEEDFEYPKGTPIRSNVWAFDLAQTASVELLAHVHRGDAVAE